MASIDLGSPVPKYYQLKEIIRDMVEKEELGVGQIIPSEREFCERYGISRMTARQAIMELVNESILYRVQGKGTFVAEKKIQHESALLTSFTQDMQARGMKTSSVVLGIEVESAGPIVARMFGVDPGVRIIRLRRVRDAGGEPMALETSHLLHEVAEGILGADLTTRSLYEELSRLGVRIARAEQSYEAGLVGDAGAEHLSVPAGSPALLVERLTFDENDRPFEYVKSTYRADRYRVTTILRP
jgi:GntR family transcriptional regulator